MSDIKTNADVKRDFNRASGQEQQGQNTSRGAPERIKPEFNHAASQQKAASQEKPAAVLKMETLQQQQRTKTGPSLGH